MVWRAVVVLAAATVMLAGCKTAEQLAQEDAAKCASYGFQIGSDGYAGCRMRLDAARDADEKARVRAVAGNIGSQRLDPAPIYTPQMPAPPRQTLCQPIPYTNNVTCTTY